MADPLAQLQEQTGISPSDLGGDKMELFKKAALASGHDESQVSEFLGSIPSGAFSTSQTTPSPTSETIRPGAVPQTTEPNQPLERVGSGQALTSFRLTQPAFAKSSVEKFSGGVNLGSDFAAPKGSPVAVPEGSWKVMESFGGATREGFIGNNDNRGFGNRVVIQNEMTGERLSFAHLGKVGVNPGETVSQGDVVALTGNTGNSTGAHVSIMAWDPVGRIVDVRNTRFSGSL